MSVPSSQRPWSEERKEVKTHDNGGLSFIERLQYFKWNWFTAVMATGGITDSLHSVPFRFAGLETIVKVVMIFNIVLFILCCVLIVLRFSFHPGSLKRSFEEPSESLYIPASVVSIGIILVTIAQNAIPDTGTWLQATFKVLFWIYAMLALLSSCCIYLILWSTQEFSIKTMTPIWVFPVYPLLIIAPLAAALINAISSSAELLYISSKTVIAGAVCLQGIGFFVSVIIYSAFIYRLMTQGLPSPQLQPSMFVSVGPAGFTATGIIMLGKLTHKAMPGTAFGTVEAVSLMVRVLAYAVGLCLWGLTVWFFILSLGGQWRSVFRKKYRMKFDVSFYAFVFPNSALVSSTNAVGKVFDWKAVEIIGCILMVMLVVTWLLILLATVWGVWKKRLLHS